MPAMVRRAHQQICADPLLRFHLRVWLWITVAFVLLALYAFGH